ncbi:MAG: transglutaminase domain-containing protein [Clostridia bacterium]
MKKAKYLVFILLIAVALSAALAGCSLFANIFSAEKDDKVEIIDVTSIQVGNSSIYMAPTGETRERQIVSTVFPENATNKKVKYDIITPGAAKYISVDSSGKVRALGNVTETPIVVRIKSVSNPNVYVDVFVSVVIVPLERIVFDTLALSVQLGTNPQVNFKIEPDYATVESFHYEVINTNNEEEIYATVDEQTGVIYPSRIGTARVRVYNTDALGETLVEGFLEINIVYAPLDYNITVRSNDDKIYKQAVEEGGFDTFEIDVWKEASSHCDPNPEISWLVNNTKIGDSSIQGAKNIIFNSAEIFKGEPGDKQISVRLESGKNDVQILELPLITVYPPLITLNLTNRTIKPQYEVNDTIEITATYGSGQYPPDSYNWYLLEEGDDEEIIISGMTANTLYYEVDRIGSFKIVCYPVVRGIKRTDLRREITLGQMQHSVTGNNISGVYIDGAPFDGGYAPYVKWDSLPYDAGDYTVEIRTGSEETQNHITLESSNPVHARYFTAHGVHIPSSTADLQTSFSIKIKAEGYNFTDWVSYEGGSIAVTHYEYLDPLAAADPVLAGMNGYIVNMKELGDLLNYVSIFRPEELSTTSGGDLEFHDGFSFSVYVPFTYDDVSVKHPSNGNPADETDPEKVNAYKLISAAFTAYADSGTFRVEYSVGVLGEINITLWFKDIITEYLSTAPSENAELPFVTHYAKQPRVTNTLPIDAISRTLSVSTSNQLYFAASLGYRPIPVAGSSAETIYNIARNVLKRIINDGMSDAEKAHAIYDYLSAEVLYDYELAAIPLNTPNINSYEGFYLEGVFIRGKAVCDGIAKSFNLLAHMEGIAAKKISGYAVQGGSSIGHAWNKINIGGEWYIVDATWGSSYSASLDGELQTHAYLLVTDNMVSSTHHTYGEHPDTTEERHRVYLDTELAEGITPTLYSDEDITKIVEEYIPLLEASGEEVWIQIYASNNYRSTFPIDPDNVILQKIGNTLGHSGCWSIGNGYFVIRVAADG